MRTLPDAPVCVVPLLKRRPPEPLVPTALAERMMMAPDVEAVPPPDRI